jgi:hypothetical protein
MIPPLNEQGCLPEGIHDCTMDEVATRFGVFLTSDRRSQLCEMPKGSGLHKCMNLQIEATWGNSEAWHDLFESSIRERCTM